MLRAKHMGFKSVKRVEVKAETTTPGEMRTTTDAHGQRVSTSRSRRTLPKLEFTVDEDGAILHGPQRAVAAGGGAGVAAGYSFFSAQNGVDGVPPHRDYETALERELMYQTASFQALHMRAFPVPTAHGGSSNQHEGEAMRDSNNQEDEEDDDDEAEERLGEDEQGDVHEVDYLEQRPMTTSPRADAGTPKRSSFAMLSPPPPMSPAPMKECILNDTRATTLAIKYDGGVNKFVCGSSIERFSGHTGVCRVLGSKKYPIIPHNLRIGDLLRIGSVGLVVCELNRTESDETQESLSEHEYAYLKEHYLSLPLQQTFHPTESSAEDGDSDKKDERNAGSSNQNRSGETSDEGESEEDRLAGGDLRDGDNEGCPDDVTRPSIGVAGVVGKRFCYICYDGDEEPEENPLVAPCHCKGDTKYVHLDCLQRWNNNLDADGSNPNQKVCAVTNTEGLDVCSICKATYLTSVKLDDGRIVSLLAKKLPPPYVTFAVVTQHETRNRSTALTNTRFQLSFANLPKNQPFLTIGRSTNNNMTLRYRTVSQLHAKIKYQNNQFIMYDAASSNGTMLFLSKPLELDWNKTVHVKIGRTILTLKSKKRWKWSGTGSNSSNSDQSDCDNGSTTSSPRPRGSNLTPRATNDFSPRAAWDSTTPPAQTNQSIPNRFDSSSNGVLNDPSADVALSPYANNVHQILHRPLDSQWLYRMLASQTSGSIMRRNSDDEEDDDAILGRNEARLSSESRSRRLPPYHRQQFDVSPSSAAAAHNSPSSFSDGTAAQHNHHHEHVLYDLSDSLSHMDISSPRTLLRRPPHPE